MKRLFLFLSTLAGLLTIPVTPAWAGWAGTHCYNSSYDDPYFKRADARAYASVAANEGYEYGGGCWNNNNYDDTPHQPDSDGEGPDCSGLVFKSWELKKAYGEGGGHWWDKMQNIHGPYSSYAFHDVGTSSSLPFYRLPDKSRWTTVYMDAFARQGHVGLIYSTVTSASGTDPIIEAKGDEYGVNVWDETWRYDSAYVGVRRKGWVADCDPRCTASAGGLPAVVVP